MGILCRYLRNNPKFYQTINAYVETLPGDDEKACFLYDGKLTEWETAMRTNMGGGLPTRGFWELKQDLYDIVKLS